MMSEKSLDEISAQIEKLGKQVERLIWMQRLSADHVLTFNHFGHLVRLFLPAAATEGVQGIILKQSDFFESGLLRKVADLGAVRAGDIVLDIGANIGNHSVFFAHVLGVAQVHAFEPQAYCRWILERNLKENDIATVQIHPLVLGAEEGHARVSRFLRGNHGATSFSASDDAGPTNMTSLDRIAPSLLADRLDFVKIDVEGNAPDVLTGAKETLMRYKPFVWCELLPRFNEYEPSVTLLESYGYGLALQLSRTDFLFAHKERPLGQQVSSG